MKMIQLFRKPYLSMFLATFIFLVSCSKYEVEENQSKQMDANTLKNTHQQIKRKLDDARKTKNPVDSDYLTSLQYEKAFSDNINYLNEYGLEALFEKYSIDPEVLTEFDYYLTNQSNEDVYQLLVDNFQFKNVDDAAFLFNLIEVYNLVVDGLELEKKAAMSGDELQRISFACAVAIAGTIATTASAAFLTGGAALIVFLVSKGIATAAIIQACT